ncbi:MAG TPA: hypothetical protein V6C90_02390, partial [Coleofasciculaceae cyanobacterium]
EWLKVMGLELKPSKTRLCHTSEGFDFLGFNVRQYQTGAYRAAKSTNVGIVAGTEMPTLMEPATLHLWGCL